MNLEDFVKAARVPKTVKPQEHVFWTLMRHKASGELAQSQPKLLERLGPFKDWVVLGKIGAATLHTLFGDVVMEDSEAELKTHWPIWREAKGRVLITGLGLGCVVRGLLANPEVTHIDCIEIDPWILKVIGKEFEGNPRIKLHLGDALKFKPKGTWDFAWHDIYTEEGNGLPLARLHVALMARTFKKSVKVQGAWNFPSELSKKFGYLH